MVDTTVEAVDAAAREHGLELGGGGVVHPANLWDVSPETPGRATNSVPAALRVIQLMGGCGDVQLVERPTTERGRRGLADRKVDDALEGAGGAVAVHGCAAPQGHPDASLRVEGEPVRHPDVGWDVHDRSPS